MISMARFYRTQDKGSLTSGGGESVQDGEGYETLPVSLRVREKGWGAEQSG